VSGMVLPVDVEVWLDEQEREPPERDREEEQPHEHRARRRYSRVETRAVSRQLWPVALIVSAGLADVAGRPSFAFYLLLAAIPVIVAATLASYGDLVAGEGGSPVRTALWTVALAVVVATVALPPLGTEALMICLVLVGIQGVAALSTGLRRPTT
jgi:hypothetical protein